MEKAGAEGCRTWFGTTTFRPSAIADLEKQAWEACDALGQKWTLLSRRERDHLIREEALYEVQKFWKRLRKAGFRFRYFLVFERHKSGAIHMHWVLHEGDPNQPIGKRNLEAQWPHGFIGARLVDPDSYDGTGRQRVAAYVTKSLATEKLARVCASQSYKPARPTLPQ